MSEPENTTELRSKENIEFIKLAHTEHVEAVKGVREFSLQGIRMMYILNGAALIALLTFIGNMSSKINGTGFTISSGSVNAIVPAFAPFVIGLICAGITSIFAYLNFSMLEAATVDSYMLLGWMRGEALGLSQSASKGTIITAWLGLFFAILSLSAFGYGCYVVNLAFGRLIT